MDPLTQIADPRPSAIAIAAGTVAVLGTPVRTCLAHAAKVLPVLLVMLADLFMLLAIILEWS